LRTVHFISVLAAAALVAILYFGVNTVPPKKAGETASASQAEAASHNARPASFDSILSAARRQLPAHAAEEVSHIENQLAAIGDSSQMAAVFDTLAKIWQDHKQIHLAAYYYLKAGKLENSEEKLNFAAQLFLDLARKADSESMQAWYGQMAIAGFKDALEINPNNETSQVNLAECYIGTGQTMEGVFLLRDITEKHPENVRANLILGQQGIVSGQLDKAIERFEKVLNKEPKSVEALLGLAEAYKNKGDKQKAIDLLEHSKEVMNHPEYSKDIDQYIKTFK